MNQLLNQKCACPNCLCLVTDEAHAKAGALFCSDACSSGHTDGKKGCGHEACHCG